MPELAWEKHAPTEREPHRKAIWDAVANGKHEVVFQPGHPVEGTNLAGLVDDALFLELARLICKQAGVETPPDMTKEWEVSFHEKVFAKESIKVDASFHRPPVGPAIVLVLGFP